MRLIGLEPTRPKSPDPKSGASTNFATGAFVGAKLGIFLQITQERKAFFCNFARKGGVLRLSERLLLRLRSE